MNQIAKETKRKDGYVHGGSGKEIKK